MRTVAILQPGYLPWLGFFDQMSRADVFVYYDDVQYDKHGWRNRNRIKSSLGESRWLTVPVFHTGLSKPKICEVEIQNDRPWGHKHIETIRQNYSKAPYFRVYFEELREILSRKWEKLVDLDIALCEVMCRWLGLERKTLRASELGIEGDRSGRLVNICRLLKAEKYLSGDSAQEYLDVPLFQARKIDVEWQKYTHPVYPQLYGGFVSHLSTLDLLMNLGDESLSVLRKV